MQGLHLHSQCLADTLTLFQLDLAILILFSNWPHPRPSAGIFNSLFYCSAALFIPPLKFQRLVRDIKPPIFFPQFFQRIFLSFSSWKRKEIFYWSKTVSFSEKFVFFFNCSNWKKYIENLENKIGCLVNWWHEQDIDEKNSFVLVKV